MNNFVFKFTEFLHNHLLAIVIYVLIVGVVGGVWAGMQAVDTSDKQSASSQPAYAQQIITVGDVQWLCLTNDGKPISCQLISPLTDDKLNNYQHIEVNG